MNARIFATVAIVAASSAVAQPRASTVVMSCEQARALVRASGAAVLSTGPTTYGRFVSSVAACERGEVTEPAFAPTADAAQCFIGYRCRDTDLDFGR